MILIYGQMILTSTTTGLDKFTELRMEKIRQAATEKWVPQVWQTPARPDRDANNPPARWAER